MALFLFLPWQRRGAGWYNCPMLLSALLAATLQLTSPSFALADEADDRAAIEAARKLTLGFNRKQRQRRWDFEDKAREENRDFEDSVRKEKRQFETSLEDRYEDAKDLGEAQQLARK